MRAAACNVPWRVVGPEASSSERISRPSGRSVGRSDSTGHSQTVQEPVLTRHVATACVKPYLLDFDGYDDLWYISRKVAMEGGDINGLSHLAGHGEGAGRGMRAPSAYQGDAH